MTNGPPAYQVERVASKPRFLKVTCVRSHCGNSFWVHAGAWRSPVSDRERSHGITTRSCPFCFMSSWVNGVPEPNTLPAKKGKR